VTNLHLAEGLARKRNCCDADIALITGCLFIQLVSALTAILPQGAKLVFQLTAGAVAGSADASHHPRTLRATAASATVRSLRIQCRYPRVSSVSGVDSHVDLRHANYMRLWELQLVFASAVAHYLVRCVVAGDVVRQCTVLRCAARVTALHA
jgi:hypothetical protein